MATILMISLKINLSNVVIVQFTVSLYQGKSTEPINAQYINSDRKYEVGGT